MRRYKVQLTKEEREQLQKLASSGVAPVRKLTRARNGANSGNYFFCG